MHSRVTAAIAATKTAGLCTARRARILLSLLLSKNFSLPPPKEVIHMLRDSVLPRPAVTRRSCPEQLLRQPYCVRPTLQVRSAGLPQLLRTPHLVHGRLIKCIKADALFIPITSTVCARQERISHVLTYHLFIFFT